MSTIPNTEIKELKDLINSRFDKLEEKVQSMEVRLATIEGRLEEWKTPIGKITDLAEKVGELKNWRQIALIVISTVAAGTLGWFLRGGRL